MNLCSHGTTERCNMYLPFIQGCFRSLDPLSILINGGHDLWHEQWRGDISRLGIWWHSLLSCSSHLLRPYYSNSQYRFFMRHGFTSGGQELGFLISAAVSKIQARKHYIESLTSVPKDKRSCFSQGERCAVQLPLDHTLVLRKQDA